MPLALSLLVSRIRLADDVQVPVVSLSSLSSDNLHSTSQSYAFLLQPQFYNHRIKPRKRKRERTKPTLQCSHLFFTELCTFIPLVCCSAPPTAGLAIQPIQAEIGLAVARLPLTTLAVAGAERRSPAVRESVRSREAILSDRARCAGLFCSFWRLLGEAGQSFGRLFFLGGGASPGICRPRSRGYMYLLDAVDAQTNNYINTYELT